MASDSRIVEVSMMYGYVEKLEDPKEVLETLAKLEAPMGWVKVEDLRFLTYCLWLQKHDKEDWFQFLKAGNDFFAVIRHGGTPDFSSIGNPPEGWIVPIDYFHGKIPESE